jgi:hypothetical protein
MDEERVRLIAQEIARQIGGQRFITMTGAKDFVCGLDPDEKPYLSFKLPGKGKNGINYVQILYEPMDWYTLRFIRVNHGKFGSFTTTTVEEVEMVYEDVLERTFSDVTGLATSLHSITKEGTA